MVRAWPLVFVASSVHADENLLPAARKHWAWQTPVRVAPPPVRDASWGSNAIDRFILAALETQGLKPASPASHEQLLRRLHFDLVGLPPTPAEIDAFLQAADRDPQSAVAGVVDRLLASPHYGERWGRHWLDLARFAESNGYEFDEVRPDAWRYRDYVIQSFNADKPYDRFIREQLAGDELYPDDPQALIATGFNLLGPDMTDSSDQAQRRQNTLNDMTDTTGLVFLGLTLGCARCHDHKFEPIPQADYYRLQAFFSPAQFRRDLPVAPKEERAVLEAKVKEWNGRMQPLLDAVAKIEQPYLATLREKRLESLPEDVRLAHRTPEDRRTPAQKAIVERTTRLVRVPAADVLAALGPDERERRRGLLAQIKTLEAQKPPVPVAMGMQDMKGEIPKTFVLERGELTNRADEVHPGFPVVLLRDKQAPPTVADTGRRAALAEWIVRPDNPLTARVLVNRLWQHHFGKGLVRTPSDFGLQGEAPTHPELLDWLACEFIDKGWSFKHMHRLMLTSATYRQSSRPSPDALTKDPDNRLVSHMNRARLEGEIIRDTLLFVSGRLNVRSGGPGVYPPIPAEAIEGAKGWTASADPHDHVRRSIYIFARRNLRFPFLEAFDLPDSNLSCPKRERSTTAPQALALLNAGDVVAAAAALAACLVRDASTDGERIHHAYRRILGRAPTPREVESATAFLKDSPLSELCRALFNVNEFVYVD
jgi:hypothetical protein